MISLFFPGGLIFFAAAVILNNHILVKYPPAVIHFYSWAVWSAGIFLGFRFNRSRLFFSMISLVIVSLALTHFSQSKMFIKGPGRDVFNAASILLPLNLLIFFMIREKGILTFRGLCRTGLIFFQPVFIYLSYIVYDFSLNIYMEYPLLAKSGFIHRFPLTHAAVISFIISFAGMFIGLFKNRGAIERGFFWSLVCVLFAFWTYRADNNSIFYLATAGLILDVSVIESSYKMAFYDELTGLSGRRALNEYLLKLGNRYSIGMIDIDFFKKFNDRYGHDIGDDVLRFTASILSGVEGGGKSFRYGGEEFTVVFPGKKADEAVSSLEKLRKKIGSSVFNIRKKKNTGKSRGIAPKKVSITVSIGVAERNKNFSTPQEVIKAADKALYRAKKAGRNRVSI